MGLNLLLEDGGVLGDLTIGEFPLHIIPLEPDLVSLELEDSFEELYLVRISPSVAETIGICF
jgi:hypothetical protein